MNRRNFLISLAGFTATLLTLPLLIKSRAFAATEAITKLVKTKDEWKKILTPEQYDVLREEGTERAFTSPLNDEHRVGMFSCVACGLDLFPSKFKFDSGTGWPSFYDHIPGHIETKTDYALVLPRTEYHCARCGGHHGHIFDDGPQPTGLRHCNNGVVLKFTPSPTS